MLRSKSYYAHVALAILFIYTILAVIYSFSVPAWEAPDEIAHYAFIKHLRQTGKLPVQTIGQLGEAHQPPLYYVLATIASLPADISGNVGAFRGNSQFVWAGQGGNEVNAAIHGSAETFPFRQQALALHLARAASVLMGLGTVAFTIKIGWDVFPNRLGIGLLAAALVAFNPQFLFISSVLSNDNLLIFIVVGASWQTLQAAQKPDKWYMWLFVGLWLAAAILTKLSGAAIVLAVGIFLIGFSFHKRSIKLLIHSGIVISITIVLISGWWFVRNQILYSDPLGINIFEQIYAANARQSPLQWHDMRHFFTTQFRSYWGIFGWMNLPSPAWFFTAVRGLLLVSIAGLGIFTVRGQLKIMSVRQKGSLAFLLLVIVMQEIIIFNMITRCNTTCYQGRFLLPATASMAFFVALGFFSLKPRQLSHFFVIGTPLFLLIAAVFMLLQVIQPAYTTPTLSKWNLWFVQNKTEVTFSPYFSLEGYQAEESGTEIELTLYWQARANPDFDYSVFIHLLDENEILIAQTDGALGETIGHLPTAWDEGDIIADTRLLTPPPDFSSKNYTVRVGIYNWATGERLPVFVEGDTPNGDFIILEGVLQQ